MSARARVAAAMLGVSLVVAWVHAPLGADERSSVEQIRRELLQLPYYGVFDFLAFSYDKGTVRIMGYAYHSTLKHDAVRAAKRASGVDQVIDEIEELPLSQFDDELRWKAYSRSIVIPFCRGTRLAEASSGATGIRLVAAFTRWTSGGSLVWNPSATIHSTSSSGTAASHCLASWITKATRSSRACGRAKCLGHLVWKTSSSSTSLSGNDNEAGWRATHSMRKCPPLVGRSV